MSINVECHKMYCPPLGKWRRITWNRKNNHVTGTIAASMKSTNDGFDKLTSYHRGKGVPSHRWLVEASELLLSVNLSESM